MMMNVWKSNMSWRYRERLRREAEEQAAGHHPPLSKDAWVQRRQEIQAFLTQKLHLQTDPTPANFRVHHTIAREGYRIDMVSYASGSPDIRVTAAMYVPDGDGPFPGIVNLHGHWAQGKISPRVQERGHLLAQNGFVVISPDVPGSGERSSGEGEFTYHGGIAGAGLYLIGDSLLGWQVRDNRRAIDVLGALPFVQADRIGVTGASGGGNQTMWLSACDERVKACVPVVSVGTFESYVTRSNCICETFPGGLAAMEEWEVLGMMAPRPVLLLNAFHDSNPTFGPEAVTRTAESVRELYRLWQADEKFDARIFNTTHGYWPEMMSAMLGWMKYWLQGEGPGFSLALPSLVPEEQDNLRVFIPGTWVPKTQSYYANKDILLSAMPRVDNSDKDVATLRNELAKHTGYVTVDRAGEVEESDAFGSEKRRRAVLASPRGTPVPFMLREQVNTDAPVDLIFGSMGKAGAFSCERFAAAPTSVTIDLPGLGELAWEMPKVAAGVNPLHTTARACLWLGYTLAGEWAECVASLTRWAINRFPGRPIRLVGDNEAALAILLAAALDPVTRGCALKLEGLPASAVEYYRATDGSMVNMIPNLLVWGDLDLMRKLAQG